LEIPRGVSASFDDAHALVLVASCGAPADILAECALAAGGGAVMFATHNADEFPGNDFLQSLPPILSGTVQPLPVMDVVRATVQVNAGRRGAERVRLAHDLNGRGLCLVLAFLTLGLRVEISPDMHGPLRAIADGNRLLRDLRARIFRALLPGEVHWLPAGAYVLWQRQHFLPARLHRATWVHIPSDCVLFCVVRNEFATAFDGMLAVLPTLIDARQRNRARLGDIAGPLTVALLLGKTDEADELNRRMARLLDIEHAIESRISMMLGHLTDVVGAGPSGGTSLEPASHSVGAVASGLPPRDVRCWFLGMAYDDEPMPFYSELARRALPADVRSLSADGGLVIPSNDGTVRALVDFSPSGLARRLVPPSRVDDRVILFVFDMREQHSLIEDVFHQAYRFATRGWRCLAILCHAGTAAVGPSADAVALMVRLGRLLVHCLLCAANPPGWDLILAGVVGLVAGESAEPWLCSRRLTRHLQLSVQISDADVCEAEIDVRGPAFACSLSLVDEVSRRRW